MTSPGSADSALTVGAVDDADEVTWFSSRGPRGGDYALKPDVTAPGDEIVAARATGTAMGTVVDDYHVATSGTSMAAPHVAGAAAVLKQARPDLTGQELKAILMGSAQHTSGTVWDEGSGRIYLPTALEQHVVASPSSLSFGVFEFPQTGSEQQTLTYENPTDTAVTLDLALDVTGPDGEPLPVGAATLSAGSVTVPAQGTATVDVTADSTVGAAGSSSGAVVATAADGGEIRTALGWYKEPELYDLTIEAVGRDGASHDGEASVGVMNVDDGTLFNEFVQFDDGSQTVRVPVGTYSMIGELWEEDAEGAITELTAAVEPEVEVTADTTVILDARQGEPVTVTTERPADLQSVTVGAYRTDGPSVWLSGGTTTVPGTVDVYATPTEPVTEGALNFIAGFALAAPTTGDEAPTYTYDLLYAQEGIENVDFAATSENTAALQVSYADLGPGADTQGRWFGMDADRWWVATWGASHPATAGSVRTEYLSADVSWSNYRYLEPDDGSARTLFTGGFRTYAPGEEDAVTIGGAVLNTRVHADRLFETWGDWLVLNIAPWADAEGQQVSGVDLTQHLRVWQDGTPVADVEGFSADVQIPAEGADHRVVMDVERDTSWWNRSTKMSTEWTFHAEPGDSDTEPVVLPVLDVAFDVDGMDLANDAPARTTATLTVGHQPGTTGGEITKARLWWSPDDGATWRKAALRRTEAGVCTTDLRVPAGTEHVSLRVVAEDAAGVTIKQTVIRAYGVR